MSSNIATPVESDSRDVVSDEVPGRQPTVSVGVPVYNGERYLEVAIRSVLAQTWDDLELVICDNCSTDRTPDICRTYAAQDRRVRYLRNERNIGAAGNFRRVFHESRAPIYRWLCSDDYIGPASIEKCLRLLQARPDAAVVCSRAEFVDEHGATLRPYDAVQAITYDDARERFRAAFECDPWCNSAYGLIRRSTLLRTALHQPFPASDKALIIELAIHGKILEIDEVLFFRRIHPGAYSYAVSSERDRSFYMPAASGGSAPMLRAWPNTLAYLRAIMRSPARVAEKFGMLAYLLRQSWWQRKEMFDEAQRSIRGIAGR
jgi:glycosyltransferase involved in cell wall biosynthesis